jgi:alpha-tubulin suppressor-like RCC1 family protein
MALTVGGSILGFGSNESGCLGLSDCVVRWKPTKVSLVLEGEEGICLRAVQIACGAKHTVALVSRQGCLEVRTTGEVSGQRGGGRQICDRFL